MGRESAPIDVGAVGEAVAARWLRQHRRFKIVTQNWRNPRDLKQEIDLVCRDGEVLVFVEVKTRAKTARVPGYFAVDQRKRRAMRRAIDAYLLQLRHRPNTFRFDVVEIERDAEGRCEVLHFENITLFSQHHWR